MHHCRGVGRSSIAGLPFLAALLGAGQLEDISQLRAVGRRLRLAFVPAPGAGLVIAEVHFAFLAPVAVPAPGWSHCSNFAHVLLERDKLRL